ncbi:MAG TPA: O-antigen ligase family protein [Bacteroidia bacterium]|nr:O-antigen ligase family protein [Bacteroidia bacterium]
MKEYIAGNKNFLLVLLFWILSGSVSFLPYLTVPLTIYLMMKKRLIEELLIGFFFILIISDSYVPTLVFAKNIKNIYMVFLIIYFLFKTNEFFPLTELHKLFLPFFLFSFLTIILSVYEPFFILGIQKTVSYFFVFLILPNYILYLYRQKGRDFLKRFLLFCLFTLIIGFILKFIAPDIANISTGRYRGVMGNPNGIGLFSFLVFLVFSMVNEAFPGLFSKSEKRLFYAVILLSILLSGSRSSIIALLIFMINKEIYKKNAFGGFIVFIIFLFVIYFINLYTFEIIRFLGLQEFLRIDTIKDASGRYIAWEFAWKQIQNNFLVGKGWGYDEYYMQQHFIELSNLGHQGGVHNSFLSFWMDQGLIGILLFIRCFVLLFIKASKNTNYAFPIMFAIIFTAIFESWLVASLSAFAFLALFIYTFISDNSFYEEIEEVETVA